MDPTESGLARLGLAIGLLCLHWEGGVPPHCFGHCNKIAVEALLMEIAKSKVAWVVGGSSGLGLAVSRALMAEGYQVNLFARDERRLAAAAAELRGVEGGGVGIGDSQMGASGGSVGPYVLDATDAAMVSSVFERAF